MVLKLAYLFLEHQISAGQLSADSSSVDKNTLYCLIMSRNYRSDSSP